MSMLPSCYPGHSFLTQILQNYLTKELPHSMLLEKPNLACGALTLLIASYLCGTASSAKLSELPTAFPGCGLRQ